MSWWQTTDEAEQAKAQREMESERQRQMRKTESGHLDTLKAEAAAVWVQRWSEDAGAARGQIAQGARQTGAAQLLGRRSHQAVGGQGKTASEEEAAASASLQSLARMDIAKAKAKTASEEEAAASASLQSLARMDIAKREEAETKPSANKIADKFDDKIEVETDALLTRARTRASILDVLEVTKDAPSSPAPRTPERAKASRPPLTPDSCTPLRETIASGAMTPRTKTVVTTALESIADELASGGQDMSAVALALCEEVATLAEELKEARSRTVAPADGNAGLISEGTQTPKPPPGLSPRQSMRNSMMQAQVEAENPNVLPPRPPPGPPPGMSDAEFKRVEERRKSLPESQRPLPPTGWNLVRKVQMANQTVQAFGAPPADMRLMPADPLKMRQRTVVLETQGKLGMALADRFRHEEHEALVVTSILPDPPLASMEWKWATWWMDQWHAEWHACRGYERDQGDP